MNPTRSVLPATTSIVAQLNQLSQADLIRVHASQPELEYIFKHALVQDAAYESLLHKTRRALHEQVAEVYEKLYADRLDDLASLLVHHFGQAGNEEKLVAYATRAGDRAQRLSAHPEAVAYYTQALEALSRLPDQDENRRLRIDTFVKRAAVSFGSADPEQSLANLRAAESLAETLLRTAEPSNMDRLRRARVQLWIGRMYHYRMERRAALASVQQVLPVARATHDEELSALAATLMARVYLWEGEFGQAAPWLEGSLAPFAQTRNWTEWIVTAGLLGVVLAARGDYSAGMAQAEHAVARAQSLHHQSGLAFAYALLAVAHLMGGEMHQMLASCRAGVENGLASGSRLPLYSAFFTQAWALSRLGQHETARQSMAQAEAISKVFGGRYLLDDWLHAVKAEMALNAQQIEEALAQAQAAVRFAQSVDGHFAEALARRIWAEALSAHDPPRWDEAESHLAQSWKLFDAGEAQLEAARTHVAWGKVLMQRGEFDNARTHFEQAVAQFEASGLEAELVRTRSLIANLG